MNLSCLSKTSTSENQFVSSSAVLVVTSSNQNMVNNPVIRAAVTPKSVPLSISLSSLVSTGGVVTLAGGWKAPTQQPIVGVSNSGNVVDAIGRLMPGKQVQIKVPVVQSPGSNPVILMPQKSSNNQSKSLFRLLPKGCHPIPASQVRSTIVNRGAQFTVSSCQSNEARTSAITPKQLPALIVPKEGAVKKTQPYQQVVLQKAQSSNALSSSSTNPSTSVTWQDLSSKTPGIHKPSYVPRKSFPNINNGVGSFQKFRILDGKAQILPKSVQESSAATTSTNHVVMQGSHLAPDKPRNTALKAVLTSAKPSTSTTAMVTLARLVPAPLPKNRFYPIQPQETRPSLLSSPPKLYAQPTIKSSSFTPVTSVVSSFRPVVSSSESRTMTPDIDNEIVCDQEEKKKLVFLRNIDLIPREQADKVRSRRFRKRRVAANPVYSGGMYISNEHEPKRHCSDMLMGALEGITPPDVIVKRPRGRPRGSTKVSSPAQAIHHLSSSTRSVRSSAPSPAISSAHMEELRQLRGIYQAVASASKAVSSATGVNKEEESASPSLRNTDLIGSGEQIGDTANLKEGNKKEGDEQNGGVNEDEHEDQCASCGRTGEVLMCDTCSRVYHLACTTPPLTAVPQGMWVCSRCRKEFKDSKSKVEWPGIVSVVHSYIAYNKRRDKDIEEEQESLQRSKKVVNGLEIQTRALTSVVLGKENLRSKAMKEKQAVHKEIVELRGMVQSVWNLSVHGKTS